MVFKRIGAALKSMPRIVSVRKKSLMDYRELIPYHGITRETQQFFTDREAVILLLWAVVSPALGLAYIIWLDREAERRRLQRRRRRPVAA